MYVSFSRGVVVWSMVCDCDMVLFIEPHVANVLGLREIKKDLI